MIKLRSLLLTLFLIFSPFICASFAAGTGARYGGARSIRVPKAAPRCALCDEQKDLHEMLCCDVQYCHDCLTQHLKQVAQNRKGLKCINDKCNRLFTVVTLEQFQYFVPNLVAASTSFLQKQKIPKRDPKLVPYSVNNRDCPKCGVVIERNQGCIHMTCQYCEHEFCWKCLEPCKTVHICNRSEVPYEQPKTITEQILPIGIGVAVGLAAYSLIKKSDKKKDKVSEKQDQPKSWISEKYDQLKQTVRESCNNAKSFLSNRKNQNSRIARQAIFSLGSYALLRKCGVNISSYLCSAAQSVLSKNGYNNAKRNCPYALQREFNNGRLPNIGLSIGAGFLFESWFQKSAQAKK